jgi:hypothetical protein
VAGQSQPVLEIEGQHNQKTVAEGIPLCSGRALAALWPLRLRRGLLNEFGTALFGTESTVLSAFRSRAAASGPFDHLRYCGYGVTEGGGCRVFHLPDTGPTGRGYVGASVLGGPGGCRGPVGVFVGITTFQRWGALVMSISLPVSSVSGRDAIRLRASGFPLSAR